MANEKKNIFNTLGTMLSGFSAPFLGDYNWQSRQADAEYKRWQMKKEQDQLSAYNEFMKQYQGGGGETSPTGSNLQAGGSPMIGTNLADNPQLMAIPDPITQKVKFAINPLWQKKAQKKIAFSADINKSKVVSKYNFDLVASNLRDYAEILRDAYKEGGAGDIYKAKLSDLVEGGFVPSGMPLASKFPRTSALKGKMFEIVGKAFPMITQQIGKEGSVRLIQSIFDRFESTIPQKRTPEANAPEMLGTTLQSFYRVVRAFDTIDLGKYDRDANGKIKADQLGQLIDETLRKADTIKIVGAEKAALDKLTKSVTEPLTGVGGKKKSGSQTFRINGKTYNIPADKVEAFKRAKQIK